MKTVTFAAFVMLLSISVFAETKGDQEKPERPVIVRELR